MVKKRIFGDFSVSVLLVLAACILAFPVDLRSASSSVAFEKGSADNGKTIFQNQCAACHTIGGGRETGPDLKGVTQKRPHDWLVKFITDPDKMFSENDPTAEKLLNEYAGVKMPDLGISQEKADDLLAYIHQQSR